MGAIDEMYCEMKLIKDRMCKHSINSICKTNPLFVEIGFFNWEVEIVIFWIDDQCSHSQFCILERHIYNHCVANMLEKKEKLIRKTRIKVPW